MMQLRKSSARLLVAVLIGSFVLPNPVLSQDIFSDRSLLDASSTLSPQVALMKGIIIHPDAPLAFDFLVDRGNSSLNDQQRKEEDERLVKYFFAALAIPETDMWVNLSPYEKERILPDNFRPTLMGRDLLEQDYALKQLTASLLSPEQEPGRTFWKRINAEVKTASEGVDVNVFHKIWIVPQRARVYEHSQGAFVVESDLDVMLDEDYQAQKQNTTDAVREHSQVSAIFRETILPYIKKEVNSGETFANLRQIYHSMILAVWYKRALKKSLLGEFYVDHSRVDGISVNDPAAIDNIYQKYVQAFKQGAYDNIQEEYDPASSGIVVNKYFSGGALPVTDAALLVESGPSDRAALASMRADVVSVNLAQMSRPTDQASLVQDSQLQGFIDGIKNPRYNSFVDVSLEAAIAELGDRAGGALGKGGLGFLTGDTWGAYHLLEKFRGCGVMPLYDRHYDKDKDIGRDSIDWDQEEGIHRVILSDGNPMTIEVPFLGRSHAVEVYWINRNGMPVFLLRSKEFFKTLYPGGGEQIQQYGFLAKAYVELMQRLEIAPKIVRLSEPQLVFVATAMENDRKRAGESQATSVFKDSQIVFTTHTPESAALPVFRDLNALGQLIDRDLFESMILFGSQEINAAEALAYRANVINGVSIEHGTVTKVAVLPKDAWKTTAIQNGNEGATWRSPKLNALIDREGLENVTGQQLFDMAKGIKTDDFQRFLQDNFRVQFSDPGRPLIGLVRRLVAYKEQRLLLPLIEWITGDRDKEYFHPETGVSLGYGLGANLLVGGHALDGETVEWARRFRELAEHPDLKGKFLYIDSTGIAFRKMAVAASDVWVSMPRPTREASGTSDGAAALNGTINIATATGGPLSYIQHGENGWLIDVFKGWNLPFVIDAFNRGDWGIIQTFYQEGARQLAQYFREAMGIYYDHVERQDPRWLEMMRRSFVDGHREVSIEVMIQKYGLLFESVLDGTGAAGYEKKQAVADAADKASLVTDVVSSSVDADPNPVGGIDLSSKNMDFEVDVAQGHVILPDMPDMDAVEFGLYQPVVVDVRPGVAVSSLVDLGV